MSRSGASKLLSLVALVSLSPVLCAYTFENSTLYPNAVYRAELATTPITLSVRAAAQPGVTYYVNYFAGHLYPGRSMDTAQLYDDGTHGDVRAGDRIWTTTLNLPAPQSALRLYQNQLDVIEFSFDARDGNNRYVAPEQGTSQAIQLGIVRDDLRAQRIVLANDVVAASHVVNIRSAEFTASRNLQTIGKRFYQAFNDDFDFLTLYRLNYTDGIPGGPGNFHWIKGLDLPRPTSTPSLYGSSGRLMGAVLQYSALASREFLHEFGHFFGFYYDKPALDLSGSRGLGFHGNTSDQLGQMRGGDFLQQLPSGNYHITEQARGSTMDNNYSALEQYMMGLVPAASVAPMTFLRTDIAHPAYDAVITPDKVKRVDIAAIQAVYGARYPDSSSSKKLFRGAFVIVSDAFATDAELAFVNTVAQHFASTHPGTVSTEGFGGSNPPSFAYATDFKGAMDTYVLDALRDTTVAIPANLVRSAAEDFVEISVTVNGQGHSTYVAKYGQALDVAVSLNPARYAGRDAEWWIHANAAQGTYWYTQERGWVRSAQPLRFYGGPLSRLKSWKISTPALARGAYEIHFAVDGSMDGRFDATVDSLVNLVVE